MSFSTLDVSSIEQAVLETQPFPFFSVEQALLADRLDAVLNDFPVIETGGSYALSELQCGVAFQQLIDELDSPEFRRVLADKFDLDLAQRPMVVTARGVSRKKDGRIHTDSTSKLVTVLLYLNDTWDAETGQLRILRGAEDMNDFVTEIPPTAGRLLAFKVTDNCWHGYPAFDGVRRSIQVNFVTNETAAMKHGKRHGLTAKLKALKHSILGR